MSGIIAAAGISAAAGLASGVMQSGMLGGGGGSGGTQSQTSQTQIPMGVQQRDSDNWELAVETANQLKGPYTGPRVANMTPEQQGLIQQLYNNVGSTNPAFAQAGAITNGLSGYNPSMVTPQSLATTNLNPYMSPYTNSVINPTMQLMDQSLANQNNQTASSAVQNKAFGGSRQGIVEGVNNAQTNLLKGQYGGQLWNQNFTQAQAAATGDITRDMTAQTTNQSAGLQGAQFRGQMANQMGTLAAQGQNSWLAGVNGAMTGQGMVTAQNQAQLDADRALWMEQRQQPIDVLNIRQNALKGSVYGQSNVSTGPGPSTNPWATGFGVASTTAGLLGQFGAFDKPKAEPNPYAGGGPDPAQAWSQY